MWAWACSQKCFYKDYYVSTEGVASLPARVFIGSGFAFFLKFFLNLSQDQKGFPGAFWQKWSLSDSQWENGSDGRDCG